MGVPPVRVPDLRIRLAGAPGHLCEHLDWGLAGGRLHRPSPPQLDLRLQHRTDGPTSRQRIGHHGRDELAPAKVPGGQDEVGASASLARGVLLRVGTFGFLCALAIPAVMQRGNWIVVLVGGPLTWLASMQLFVVGIKRRWGERPDAENHPLPHSAGCTAGRRTGSCSGFCGSVSLAPSSRQLDLSLGPIGHGGEALFLAASVWWWSTTWAERKRRQASD
jgi:hypothetical protein